MGIRKYVNQFRSGEQGYEYTGTWYRLPETEGEIKKKTLLFAAELFLITLLFFLGLTGRNAGSYIFWILIPYMCQFLPAAYGWMGVYALRRAVVAGRAPGRKGKAPDPSPGIWLRQMDYDRSIRRLWRCGLGLTLLSGITLIMNSLLVLPHMDKLAGAEELLFMLIAGVLFADSLILSIQSKRLLRKVAFQILSKKEKI